MTKDGAKLVTSELLRQNKKVALDSRVPTITQHEGKIIYTEITKIVLSGSGGSSAHLQKVLQCSDNQRPEIFS